MLQMTKMFEQSLLVKLKHHSTILVIQTKGKRRVGRPSKNLHPQEGRYSYQIQYELSEIKDEIENKKKRVCIFVVVSTKREMSAEAIFREYKAKSSLERKFQFMKSPQFFNSFY